MNPDFYWKFLFARNLVKWSKFVPKDLKIRSLNLSTLFCTNLEHNNRNMTLEGYLSALSRDVKPIRFIHSPFESGILQILYECNQEILRWREFWKNNYRIFWLATWKQWFRFLEKWKLSWFKRMFNPNMKLL